MVNDLKDISSSSSTIDIINGIYMGNNVQGANNHPSMYEWINIWIYIVKHMLWNMDINVCMNKEKVIGE